MGFSEAQLQGEQANVPKWQRDLELKSDDPALPKLNAIVALFDGLTMPEHFLSPVRQLKSIVLPTNRQSRDLADYEVARRERGVDWDEAEFKYGVDYFFGINDGTPEGAEQNAETALYQSRKGVELWRVMKSVAFSLPDNTVAIVHVRGDREIDTAALANVLKVEASDLGPADAKQFGEGYGTVNPFIQHSALQIRHVFDRDLVAGKEFPNDDTVFTSPGDKRFYVGFDIHRYLQATHNYYPTAVPVSYEICKKIESIPERVIARRPVGVFGGDPTIDTASYGQQIAASITSELEKHVSYGNHSSYFGDRSLPPIEIKSNPTLAASIDTARYAEALRASVGKIIAEFQKPAHSDIRPLPIVTFSSMAMHGAGGPLLRTIKDAEYVGPQEALKMIMDGLKNRNIEIAHTALLGLDSAYDEERSAFTGDILDNAAETDQNARNQIQAFIKVCKTGKADSEEFYKIVKKVLGRAAQGKIEDKLKGKNVLVILGASELETFATMSDKVPDNFAMIRSHDPNVIAEEIAKYPDKPRLILIRPGQAVADLIAKKTIEVSQ